MKDEITRDINHSVGISYRYFGCLTMSGTIKSIDTQKDTVTLQNGKTYPVPVGTDLSSFKPGDKVKLTYSRSKGKIEISAISPAT
jgi:hypothetical protein